MSELCWYNGEPFAGIEPDAPAPETPNFETYWVDGHSASDLLLLADSWPYVPPPPQPAPDPSPWGSETYWVDGHASNGLVDDPDTRMTGSELYWFDGQADYDLFPVTDIWPPNPPPYIPPATSSFYGNETFWVDGYAAEGLKTPLFVSTNSEFYWVNGQAEAYIFTQDQAALGRMFLIFE